MATIDLTKETFAETVQKDGIVLIDWWASWCGPCHSFAPIYQEASEKHTDITFTKIDTEAEQELAAQADIQSIPMIMLFRDGVLLFSQPGVIPAEALDDVISQARALDMDEVRRQIAEHEAGHDHDHDHGGASEAD